MSVSWAGELVASTAELRIGEDGGEVRKVRGARVRGLRSMMTAAAGASSSSSLCGGNDKHQQCLNMLAMPALRDSLLRDYTGLTNWGLTTV